MENELKDYVYGMLTDLSIPVEQKHALVDALHAKNPTLASVKQVLYRSVDMRCRNDEMGFFGGIWVRKLFFPTTEAHNKGHSHDFDHVTLLARGSLRVEVDGKTSQLFTAPTFVVIRKNTVHNLLPQEPNTLAFCLHAFRDGIAEWDEKTLQNLASEGIEDLEFFTNKNDPLIADL